ncbi:MAG: hypothetical protein P8Z30_03115, partial [Acidobacteriota bacterium]
MKARLVAGIFGIHIDSDAPGIIEPHAVEPKFTHRGDCNMRVRLKNVRILCYLLVAVALAWTAANAATVSPLLAHGYTVMPEPQKVELKGGDFEFGSGWRLQLGQGVKLDDIAVTSLEDGLKKRDGITLET